MTTRQQSLAICSLFACCAAACADSAEAANAVADEPAEAALQASQGYARITQVTSEGSGCPPGSSIQHSHTVRGPDGAVYMDVPLIENLLWARTYLPTEQSLECNFVLTVESSDCLAQGGTQVILSGVASLGDGVRARLQVRYGFLDAGSDAMHEHTIPIIGPRGFSAEPQRGSEDGYEVIENIRAANTLECKRVRQLALSSRLTIVNSEPKQESLFTLRTVSVIFRPVPPDDEGDGILDPEGLGERD